MGCIAVVSMDVHLLERRMPISHCTVPSPISEAMHQYPLIVCAIPRWRSPYLIYGDVLILLASTQGHRASRRWSWRDHAHPSRNRSGPCFLIPYFQKLRLRLGPRTFLRARNPARPHPSTQLLKASFMHICRRTSVRMDLRDPGPNNHSCMRKDV